MTTGRMVLLAIVVVVALTTAQRLYADAHAPSVRVEAGDIHRTIVARAEVVAKNGTARATSTTNGRIIALSVDVGDHVTADQMLAPIEGIGPSQPFDPLGEDEGLRAPIAGVVVSRNAQVGDLVSPLTPTMEPLFEIADTSRLELRIEIEERDAEAVSSGMTVHVGDATTTIARLAPRIERRANPLDDIASRSSAEVRLAWASLPDGDQRILGEHVEVTMDSEVVHAAAMLPRAAITIRDGNAIVRVRDGMSVREVRVTLGAVDGENAEVEGVEPGAEVMLAP